MINLFEENDRIQDDEMVEGSAEWMTVIYVALSVILTVIKNL